MSMSPTDGSSGASGASSGGSDTPAQASRANWVPLGSASPTSAGPGGPGMPIPGGPGRGGTGRGNDERLGPARGGYKPYPTGPGPEKPGAGTAPGSGQVKHLRTDFVLLFIWKEPTPSDKLRAGPSDGGGATPAAAPASGPGRQS
jgi:hypothetical protein